MQTMALSPEVELRQWYDLHELCKSMIYCSLQAKDEFEAITWGDGTVSNINQQYLRYL
jgi:hypothetical protein